MASLWKNPRSKYWIACYTDLTGRRLKKSTRLTDQKKAQKVADVWEEAARKALSRGKAHRVLAEIFEDPAASGLTVESFLNAWVLEVKPTVSDSTYSTYEVGVRSFLASMGDRAQVPLLHLSRADVMRYRASLAGRHPVTGNQRLKLLKMALRHAREQGHAFDDPFVGVKLLKTAEATEDARRPFTIPEIQHLLSVADAEWKSLVLFGLYTGARLGDLATLRRHQIDLDRGEISLTTKKTGRRMVIPLHSALADMLKDPDAPRRGLAEFLHPRAAELVAGAKGKVSTLSRHFGELLVTAGLRAPEGDSEEKKGGHEKKKDGRAASRTQHALSFHCLRHSARSMLEAAGVPLATAMELLGHSDTGSSLRYTHHDTAALRKATETIPRLP